MLHSLVYELGTFFIYIAGFLKWSVFEIPGHSTFSVTGAGQQGKACTEGTYKNLNNKFWYQKSR